MSDDAPSPRAGAARISVRNSGREVWLYDDASLEKIQASRATGSGGAPGNLGGLMRQGLVLGYSLQQDDDLDIAVYVGDPLSESELAVAAWLEPQTALLRLPSGKLCVESNDASRIGAETPTETGSLTIVPPGDYRVTLCRIDYEALFREGREWHGPQEVIVLTPGGSARDAVDDLLPYRDRRDTNWVGRYTIDGRRADVLVWFDNYWDGFVVNLDGKAIAALAVTPGSFIRTHVPAAGITMISTYASSWQEAAKLPLPADTDLTEFGYAVLRRLDDWDGAEAVSCRRERAAARVEARHHYTWTAAQLEVLDVKAAPPRGRSLTATQLESKRYFDDEFLAMVLSQVLPETEDLAKLPLKKALNLLGKRLGTLGLEPVGDHTWGEPVRADTIEMSCRLYAGLPDRFAAILVSDGRFEIVFLSELDDDSWILTGLADEMEIRVKTKGPNGLFVDNPRVRFQMMDETLGDIFATHSESVSESQLRPAPSSPEACVAAFRRFLDLAFVASWV